MFTLSIFFVIVALFYYNSVLANQVAELQNGVDATKVELKKYDKINREIKILEKSSKF